MSRGRQRPSSTRSAIERLVITGDEQERSMPAITREDVAHLASLARLALTDDELDHYAGQLDVILAAVASISEVAADDIPPTTHAVPVVNVFRDDVVTASLDRDSVLDSAPAAEDGRFRVPRILDEE